jgi:hypothetical protein
LALPSGGALFCSPPFITALDAAHHRELYLADAPRFRKDAVLGASL